MSLPFCSILSFAAFKIALASILERFSLPKGSSTGVTGAIFPTEEEEGAEEAGSLIAKAAEPAEDAEGGGAE